MLLEARNISFSYPRNKTKILDNISLKIKAEDKLALLGPSGCGKSTLGKILSGYLKPDHGEILLDGNPLPTKGFYPVQMVHQHPELSVNPRHKMQQILKEGWEPDAPLLEKMGIENEWLKRWPRELSGGELQRFCIARVLSAKTRFLICDEISTMLDVITQAQIWQIVLEIAEQNQLGLLVITHKEALARKVCQKIITMRTCGFIESNELA